MRRFIWLLLFLAFPAFAQQSDPTVPPNPAPPSNPCVRTGSTIRLGGVDLTELKCRLLVDDERIAQLDKQMRAIETARVIAQNDLQAAEKRERDLAEWFKGWFGEGK